MFRLLVWNIQNFVSKRINNSTGANAAAIMDNQQRSFANLLYIMGTIQEADPDVFVILEARCTQGGIQTLASGNGPNGLLYLLGQMRLYLSPLWFLVPPLRVNARATLTDATHTETVGVFWRNDRVNFTGPYQWPNANVNTGPPIAPGTGLAATYQAPWTAAVPPGTTAAARCRFYRANNTEIPFCDPQAHYAQVARRPFMTTFTEVGGMARNIKLFSVHTKPGISARDAVLQMVRMQAADINPGANGVTIFAGDFNLDLINRGSSEQLALDEFSDRGFGVRVPALQNGGLAPSRVLPLRAAQPTIYHYSQLYDYAFSTYGAGALPAPPPPALPGVIADRVAGIAPGGVLPAFTTDMATPLNTILAGPATNLVNIAAAPHGAVRVNEITTITTTAAHGLYPGDAITLAGVTNISFNDIGYVVTVPSATTFTFEQEEPDATSGGGTVDTQPRLNNFRRRWNYGHICQPKSGTSDHLAYFLLA